MICVLALLACVVDGKDIVYHADKALHSVAIAGTFNGWNKAATFLAEDSDGRTWRIHLSIEPGKILYKFILDDSDWITDPQNPKTESDGNGHVNSLLMILPPDYDAPARKGAGVITRSALSHRREIPDVNFDRGFLSLSLRVRPNELEKVSVRTDSGTYPAVERPIDELYSRYTARIPWDGKADLSYAFELDDARHFYYGPNGLTEQLRGNEFKLVAKEFKPFVPPSWAEGSVIYQIFPDRFANGDTKNDPANVVPWDAKPTFNNWYGGDIAGVSQHLDYLKGLGITSVYFNPVFASPSNHRYETSDYLKIDPRFGTNEEFAKLTRKMRGLGIRTIVDGVFNHTATNFPAFSDILQKQQASPYLDWYTVKRFPVTVEADPPYVAWFNYPSMPKLNVLNPPTRDYLLNVLNYWDKNAAISGWRLDTGNEVKMDYWRLLRARLKSLNPNYWIVGEEWGDASPWLKGDQWDSTMNYPFREAVLRFVGKSGNGKASELMNALMANFNAYPPQVARNLMNLLGSHDTPRLLTECGDDKGLAELAAIIQFCWVGVPSIYYGDELGMAGGHDPENRAGMRWDLATRDNEFLTLYKRLIAIRTRNVELQSGDPVPLMADDNRQIVAFGRALGPDSAVVAVNRSTQTQSVTLPLKSLPSSPVYVDCLSGLEVRTFNHSVSFSIPADRAVILVPSRPKSRSATASPKTFSRSARRFKGVLHGSQGQT